MSRYKATWKEFDLNKDFWKEVFVGRKIISLGPGEKNVRVDGNPAKFLNEMLLDSEERVWFSEDTIFPQKEKVVGFTITALVWCDNKGIDHIKLDNGEIIILPSIGWRLCIQD